MNVRTPAASRASSFGRGLDGAHGYSHATSIGVAQYEFGIGLRHIVLVIGRGSGLWNADATERSELEELEELSWGERIGIVVTRAIGFVFVFCCMK